MNPSPVDWQLPDGVSRGMWEYVHDTRLARTYDDCLRDTPLLQVDRRFVERHCPSPGRLIDLGCGTGRVLVPMARLGHWAVGVDLSEEMLVIAGEKARAAGVGVERLKANLVCLDGIRDASFDHALCLFSTLGMIAGPANRRRVIDHVFRLLRPGGVFVLHVHNKWFNCWNPQGRRWLWRDFVRSLRGSPEAGDRVMPAHDGQSQITLHLFTRGEATRMLRSVGFRLREVCPVNLASDGVLRHPFWFGALRTYGYLIAAEKPERAR